MVGNNKTGVESDTKLAYDILSSFLLIKINVRWLISNIFEIHRTTLGNGSKIFSYLIPTHTDTRVKDCDCSFLLISGDFYF